MSSRLCSTLLPARSAGPPHSSSSDQSSDGAMPRSLTLDSVTSSGWLGSSWMRAVAIWLIATVSSRSSYETASEQQTGQSWGSGMPASRVGATDLVGLLAVLLVPLLAPLGPEFAPVRNVDDLVLARLLQDDARRRREAGGLEDADACGRGGGRAHKHVKVSRRAPSWGREGVQRRGWSREQLTVGDGFSGEEGGKEVSARRLLTVLQKGA